MRRTMTIGQLAKAAGVNVETVRYYQRRGLIGEPAKPPGGQRRYGDSAAERIGFIRRAQQLGFTLEETKTLLDLCEGGSFAELREFAAEKSEVLASRTAELNRMRRELKALVKRCTGDGRADFASVMALFGKDRSG